MSSTTDTTASLPASDEARRRRGARGGARPSVGGSGSGTGRGAPPRLARLTRRREPAAVPDRHAHPARDTAQRAEQESPMALDAEVKKAIIAEYATHEGDTGSPEVQIAMLT